MILEFFLKAMDFFQSSNTLTRLILAVFKLAKAFKEGSKTPVADVLGELVDGWGNAITDAEAFEEALKLQEQAIGLFAKATKKA